MRSKVKVWPLPSGIRTPGSVAHKKSRFNEDGFGAKRRLRVQESQSKLGSPFSDRGTVLVDSRKGNTKTVGVPDVPTTDDRDVFRNLQACVQDRFHGSE